MQLKPANRWSLAFADLSLLMLGFIVLSFVQPAVSVDKAEVDLPAIEYDGKTAMLFEPGEAMLTIAGREKASEVAQAMDASTFQISLSMAGSSGASTRLDQWELSAARMAAFARALTAAGVDEAAILIGKQSRANTKEPQRLIIAITPSTNSVAPTNGTALASQMATNLEE